MDNTGFQGNLSAIFISICNVDRKGDGEGEGEGEGEGDVEGEGEGEREGEGEGEGEGEEEEVIRIIISIICIICMKKLWFKEHNIIKPCITLLAYFSYKLDYHMTFTFYRISDLS